MAFYNYLRNIALLAALAVSSLVHAINAVTFETADGQKISFAISESPIITLDNTDLVVSASGTSIRIPLLSIKKYTFSEIESEKIATDIDAPSAKKLNAEQSDGTITISGIDGEAPVRIYSTDGRLLLSTNANASGTLTLPLGNLPQGMVIVQTRQTSIKVLTRQ